MPKTAGSESAVGLPVPLTTLLGRERELEETMRLLESTRLLTITGAGGSGKTRLALELAHDVAGRFDDHVAWIDLSEIADPQLIPQQLLTVLRLREVPNRTGVQVVIDKLRDSAALLVFDNCEHLVDACASIADAILRGCPNVSILTTSREALGITGEQTWLVPPLAEHDATQLFVERAHAVLPSFALTPANQPAVAQICQRLDGIPLAIELAAARVKVLSVEQIAERLADAFRVLNAGSRTVPRHRTIRETIDWSYRLLSEDEQTLLRRLAVFAGSFSLDAAEAVCGANVLELLSALVDKSLVMRQEAEGEARYRLLETVRQFAAEKLEASGERERHRELHARFFVSLMESFEPLIFAGSAEPTLMARLDLDLGNLRTVFDWVEEDFSRSEIELRLLYAMHWHWFARGHFHEARRRITTALQRPMRGVDEQTRARGMVAAGQTAAWQADWPALRPMMDDAVEILRRGDDARPLAAAQCLLATGIAFTGGDSRPYFDEALATARGVGRELLLSLVLYWSAIAAQMRGDNASARAAFEEAHSVGVELQSRPGIGHPLTGLGHLALRERKYDEAVRCFQTAMGPFAEIDDRWGMTQAVEGVGLVLLATDDAEEGIRLLAAAEAAWLQLGAQPARDEEFERQKDARIRQALGNDRLRVVLASGAAMPYEAMVAVARAQAERLTATPAMTASAAAAPAMRVRALGALEIEIEGQPPDSASQSARSRELLLYLLCHPQGRTKEQIGAALWPDVDAARLRNNFHVTMHRLRKAIGNPEWIVSNGEAYAVDRKLAVDFDADVFEKEVKAATKQLGKDPHAVARLAAAIELYRGDFLENVTAGEWIDEFRDRLRDVYASALAALGRSQLAAGDHEAASQTYQRLFALDDLDEEAARSLMTSLAKSGNKSAAGRVYRRLTDSLRRELDTEPDPATSRLHMKIAAGELG